MIRTFLDTSVYITARCLSGPLADRAMATIEDPERALLSSDLVRLELLPKAVHHRTRLAGDETVAFYERLMSSAEGWALADRQLFESAYELACRWGLAAMDAYHVAAALRLEADELVTCERPTSALCRIAVMPVHSLRA